MESPSGLAVTADDQRVVPDAIVEDIAQDPMAFEAIYERHAAQIYSYARVRMRDAEEVADVTQQVFLKALNGLPRYRDRGLPIVAWLFRIAHNSVVDAHRRRRPTVSWDLLPPEAQPEAGADPATDAVEQERLTELAQLLNDLPADKRELLALRFAGQLKIRDIARVLDRTEGAVKMDLRRTLATLRKAYHAD